MKNKSLPVVCVVLQMGDQAVDVGTAIARVHAALVGSQKSERIVEFIVPDP